MCIIHKGFRGFRALSPAFADFELYSYYSDLPGFPVESNWNGTNNNGVQIPAGIYLSRITTDNTPKTSKLMLLK